VVEVDITHTDIDQNSLYAEMGVPEFWRFNGREWRGLCWTNGEYVEGDRSLTFSLVDKADLYHLLETGLVDEVAAEVNFRQWVRQQLQSDH
jgi:Uma2 family endonuclease